MDYKASQEDYLRALARRALGPVAAQPDAISRVVIPPAPRSRRGAVRAPPAAPAPAVMPIAAGNQAAPVAPIVAAPAAQGSVLPVVPFQQADPQLAQATTFDVSD
ncbi:hypothetical protein AAVH_15037 [Aphelenchoides avenae]|nr:hypothetical protein AAVH_15037 [Aphelenchus avenae]